MPDLARLNCVIEDGLMPAEKIVRIQSADGETEEVLVSSRNIAGGMLLVSEIGKTDDRILVELPRESASGRWRIWVNAATVGA